jgi:O-antigen/teichoic acid export membrane protein
MTNDTATRESGFRRRFSAYVGLTLVTRLLMLAGGLGTSIIVARWLGAGGLGAFAVLNVTVAVAAQIGCAGLPSANTFFVSQDQRTLARVVTNSLVFAFIVGGALALALSLLATTRPALLSDIPPVLIIIALVSLPFQLVTLLIVGLLLPLNRVGTLNMMDAAGQFLLLVSAIVALVLIGAGLRVLVSLNSVTVIAMSLLIVWIIARIIRTENRNRFARPDWQLFKRMMRYGVKFHLSIVAGMIIIRADLLIVNHFRGASEAGVYGVASQMANLMMLLPSTVGMLLFPRVASEPDPGGELTTRVTRHTAFIMFLVCLAAAPFSVMLPYVYGAAFSNATVQLLILLPGVYLLGIESVMVQHFSGTGLPLAIPLFWIGTVVCNVALNLAFVPAFGARAAAVTSTLSYALIFVLVAVYFRLKTGNRFSAALLLRNDEFRDLLRMSPLSFFRR